MKLENLTRDDWILPGFWAAVVLTGALVWLTLQARGR
jgi:hypothetical protein